jgi:Zn-dependent protease
MGILYARDFASFAIHIVALAICITIHEYAHAKRADMAGDPTPRRSGRLSLNPIDHYDPLGSTLILLFGIGWAKPVPINPYNFRNPRRDAVMVSLWGPLSNIILAVALGSVVRLAHFANPMVIRLLISIALLSLILAVFNLIPVPPLDGSHILSGLLPLPQAQRYEFFAARYGILLLLAAVFLASNLLIRPIMYAFIRFVSG